jgi:hypothetical protein
MAAEPGIRAAGLAFDRMTNTHFTASRQRAQRVFAAAAKLETGYFGKGGQGICVGAVLS